MNTKFKIVGNTGDLHFFERGTIVEQISEVWLDSDADEMAEFRHTEGSMVQEVLMCDVEKFN